jgi:hypothetical protein
MPIKIISTMSEEFRSNSSFIFISSQVYFLSNLDWWLTEMINTIFSCPTEMIQKWLSNEISSLFLHKENLLRCFELLQEEVVSSLFICLLVRFVRLRVWLTTCFISFSFYFVLHIHFLYSRHLWSLFSRKIHRETEYDWDEEGRKGGESTIKCKCEFFIKKPLVCHWNRVFFVVFLMMFHVHFSWTVMQNFYHQQESVVRANGKEERDGNLKWISNKKVTNGSCSHDLLKCCFSVPLRDKTLWCWTTTTSRTWKSSTELCFVIAVCVKENDNHSLHFRKKSAHSSNLISLYRNDLFHYFAGLAKSNDFFINWSKGLGQFA